MNTADTIAAVAPAPRKIVVCLDGTNNEPGDAQTNVQRIYRLITRIPDKQLSYYQPGVGTLEPVGQVTRVWTWFLMLLDSANGWMMKRHACAAYEYLCETYRRGDEVYLFGFSRGAQSARILAGMLTTVGILHPGMREMVPFAWKTYTSWAPFSAWRRVGEFFSGPERKRRRKDQYFRRVNMFKGSFGRPVRVRFMGLWDTVSSVGWPWDPKVYMHTDSNHGVDIVRHALALDERRVYFEHKPWTKAMPQQNVLEVWFPGVHADVGGGYGGQASETAKISLAWMIAELEATTSVKLHTKTRDALKLPNLADPKVVAKAANRSRHDELDKFRWRLVEYLPTPRWLRDTRDWKLTVIPHRCQRRPLPQGANIHCSVLYKMGANANYKPPLPSDYHQVAAITLPNAQDAPIARPSLSPETPR